MSAAGPGDAVTIAVTVRADASRSANVVLAVYNRDPDNGRWVQPLQQVWEDRTFTAGQTQTFTTTWNVPDDEPSAPTW